MRSIENASNVLRSASDVKRGPVVPAAGRMPATDAMRPNEPPIAGTISGELPIANHGPPRSSWPLFQPTSHVLGIKHGALRWRGLYRFAASYRAPRCVRATEIA